MHDKQKRVKARIVRPKNRNYEIRWGRGKDEKRMSVGSQRETDAEYMRQEVEAKLRLDIDPTEPILQTTGPNMAWADFRDAYFRLKHFRSEVSKESAEVRLDICERIVRPKRLADMVRSDTLARLQMQLLNGKAGKGPRSPHTVESYMLSLIAALNWAHRPMKWLPHRVEFDILDVDELEGGKGRPVTQVEFDAMLEAVDDVCPVEPESWRFFLRGLWESGLRLGEAYSMTWESHGQIQPVFLQGGHVGLRFPAKTHKRRKDELTPSAPGFGELLKAVALEERTGFVFNPAKQHGSGRYRDSRKAGAVVSRIGKSAGVYVTDRKPASAHDIRRGFCQRMADAGVPIDDLMAMSRHRSRKTLEQYYVISNAGIQAERIARYLTKRDEPSEKWVQNVGTSGSKLAK